jgi:hypothetical protein
MSLIKLRKKSTQDRSGCASTTPGATSKARSRWCGIGRELPAVISAIRTTAKTWWPIGAVAGRPNFSEQTIRTMFQDYAEQVARDDLEKAHRLSEAGYDDLLEKVVDGEIDIDTAMQIFDGRRP